MKKPIFGVFILTALLLSACAETPKEQSFAEITFQHLPPLKLDVGEIKYVSEFKATLASPHVEHELPVKIDQSVQRWVRDRLQPVGNPGAYAVVTLKDASVVEKKLAKKSGLSGFFTNDQSDQYDFHVSVEIKIVTVSGSKGLATAEVFQTKTVSEDATLNERDQMFFVKTETLMREFNTQMEKNIYTFLSPYLK